MSTERGIPAGRVPDVPQRFPQANGMSKRLPQNCQFFMEPGFQCGRTPVAADYLRVSDIEGETLVTSNCQLHDNARARRYALAKGFVRRDRKPNLRALSEDELVAAYFGGEPA